MAANIAHAMAPAQRRGWRRCAPEKRRPRRRPGGATRALHNQYLALPVVFFMLSGHAPLLFAGPRRIGVAIAALGAGFVIRRFFLSRAKGLGSNWALAAVAALLLLAMLALAWPAAPVSLPAANARQALALAIRPSPAAAQSLIDGKCGYCHAAEPLWPGLARAPAGLDFSNSALVKKNAAAILRAAVLTSTMPPPGADAPLDSDDRICSGGRCVRRRCELGAKTRKTAKSGNRFAGLDKAKFLFTLCFT